MKRRDFGKRVMLGGLVAAIGPRRPSTGRAAEQPETTDLDWRKPRRALMHVGCQWGEPTDEMLSFKKRHGVNQA